MQSISAAVQRNLRQVADKHGLPVAAAEEKPKIPLKEPEAKVNKTFKGKRYFPNFCVVVMLSRYVSAFPPVIVQIHNRF